MSRDSDARLVYGLPLDPGFCERLARLEHEGPDPGEEALAAVARLHFDEGELPLPGLALKIHGPYDDAQFVLVIDNVEPAWAYFSKICDVSGTFAPNPEWDDALLHGARHLGLVAAESAKPGWKLIVSYG
jgi:hypothetical protein